MLESFDPNGPGLDNGNFIGLPFDEISAELILLPVPWDVTVSYQDGTALGPENIRKASPQLDLRHPATSDEWKRGIFYKPNNPYWEKRNAELRPLAKSYIDFLESGGDLTKDKKMRNILDEVNYTCENLASWVETETQTLLNKEKLVGLIGGEHSVPLGYYRALSKRYSAFGILQIDAHMDLREAYEGFQYSHASIFRNALAIDNIIQLTQVGIRDFCEEEEQFAVQNRERIQVFYDYHLKKEQFRGKSWQEQCREIIASLPDQVHVSLDIDGLNASYGPHTGTPVPGGLSYEQVEYLLILLVESGKKLIGFDLCEVAGPPHEWDGNVGARLGYLLSILLLKSHSKG